MKFTLLYSLVFCFCATVFAEPPPRPIGPPAPRPDLPITPIPETDPPAPPVTPPPPPAPPVTPPPAPPVTPPPPPAPPIHRYPYSAIAYSYTTGRWGVSTNQPDPATAIRVAQQYCGARDCDFTHWGENKCIALSRSGYSGVSFAEGSDSRSASWAAYDSCQRSFGACAHITHACSTGYY